LLIGASHARLTLAFLGVLVSARGAVGAVTAAKSAPLRIGGWPPDWPAKPTPSRGSSSARIGVGCAGHADDHDCGGGDDDTAP
jgi:hypothetical protein